MNNLTANRWQPGTIVRLDREKFEGFVCLEQDTSGEQLPFQKSTISLDERFLNEVMVGAQFFCEILADDNGNRRIETMYPRDTMFFNGVIKEVRRLEGVAEVTPETLATTVAFSRTHLDRPDDFRKLRVGDRVKIEMEFYNLIAKRKPPRATRVHLCESSSELEFRPRPALRRSRSLSEQTSTAESEEFGGHLKRRRSSSHSRSFGDDFYSTRHGFGMCEREPEPAPPLLYNRPTPSMLMPPIAHPYSMPAHAHFNPMGASAGWMPGPCSGLRPPCMSFPMPNAYAQAYQGPPPFHPARSFPAQSPWVASGFRENMERQEQESSTWEQLMSVLNRPAGQPGGQVDDSDVVIEMTIEELRNLMRERPQSRPRNHDR